MLKRLFDLALSVACLVVMSPLFAIIAVCIKAESDGSVFYRSARIGLHGIPFRIFKFRTMVMGADASGVSSTPSDDPRITRVGAFLRTYKLDELPQLINVVRGEMSIVGPRPQVPWAVARYDDREWRLIVTVRPGLTDPASVRFANEG